MNSTIHYFGLMILNVSPVRDPASKFYLSTEFYPEGKFPPYATGAGYALSKQFLSCAVEEMASMRTMWWEDVATGMLAASCNTTLVHSGWDRNSIGDPGLYFQKRQKQLLLMQQRKQNQQQATMEGIQLVPIAHKISPENQYQLYQNLPLHFTEELYKVPLRCPDDG